MNTVTFTSKAKKRPGMYEYSFLVNDEPISFFVIQYRNPDSGSVLGWMFTDCGADDAGEYSASKSSALYALCCYLLTRQYVQGLGFCATMENVSTEAEALYQSIVK